MSMCKSNRVKVFKASGDSDIQIFIKRFGEELITLKQMVGINDELTKQEYVPIFRASLEFSVIERVDQVFKKDPNNPKDWDTIEIGDLHKLMKEEFGAKHTDVANVLKQFGPSRLIKSSDKSVQDFYYEWSLSIPEIMKPTTDQDRKDFVDLIHRSMYYISLEDTYLQQALSDLKTPKPTLKDYFDETVAAESRRRCFQDITTSDSNLDSARGVTISKWNLKWDASFRKKKAQNDSESKITANAETKDNTKKKSSDNKSNTKPTEADQTIKVNIKAKKFCNYCKNSGHVYNTCFKLKNKNDKSKQINKVNHKVDSKEDYDDQGFGSFHAL